MLHEISPGMVSRKVSLGEISGNGGSRLPACVSEHEDTLCIRVCMSHVRNTARGTREYDEIVQGETESRGSRMRKERLRRYSLRRLSNRNVISSR